MSRANRLLLIGIVAVSFLAAGIFAYFVNDFVQGASQRETERDHPFARKSR